MTQVLPVSDRSPPLPLRRRRDVRVAAPLLPGETSSAEIIYTPDGAARPFKFRPQ